MLSDHPFAVLQGDWVTDEQKQAALQFRDFLLNPDQQRLALSYGFRPANATVTLTDADVSHNPFVSLADLFPNAGPTPCNPRPRCLPEISSMR
jgi:ABC-type sulfate transport system substrate-binding protein